MKFESCMKYHQVIRLVSLPQLNLDSFRSAIKNVSLSLVMLTNGAYIRFDKTVNITFPTGEYLKKRAD